MVISVISKLAYYYSINNNVSKITSSVNIIKELIELFNNDSSMCHYCSFAGLIESWNLQSIIKDYTNKNFNDELSKYNTINYDNLTISADVDYQIAYQIKNTPLDSKYSWGVLEEFGSSASGGTISIFDKCTSKKFFPLNVV